MDHKRLEETIKTTKFIKRILSFYKPLSHQFSDLLKKNKNVKNYVEIGCELITNLVSMSEGIRFLSENKFLQQISECLLQLNPVRIDILNKYNIYYAYNKNFYSCYHFIIYIYLIFISIIIFIFNFLV